MQRINIDLTDLVIDQSYNIDGEGLAKGLPAHYLGKDGSRYKFALPTHLQAFGPFEFKAYLLPRPASFPAALNLLRDLASKKAVFVGIPSQPIGPLDWIAAPMTLTFERIFNRHRHCYVRLATATREYVFYDDARLEKEKSTDKCVFVKVQGIKAFLAYGEKAPPQGEALAQILWGVMAHALNNPDVVTCNKQ